MSNHYKVRDMVIFTHPRTGTRESARVTHRNNHQVLLKCSDGLDLALNSEETSWLGMTLVARQAAPKRKKRKKKIHCNV